MTSGVLAGIVFYVGLLAYLLLRHFDKRLDRLEKHLNDLQQRDF